jgi:alkylation response protein AidB-like acyl-CoA dehydrogenase
MACAVAVLQSGVASVAQGVAGAVQSGAMTLAPALLERSDRYGETSATVEDGRLNGVKKFVDFGQSCSHHLVHAIGAEGAGLYLVAAGAPEVRCLPLDTTGRTPQAHVEYRGAPTTFAGDVACFERLMQIGTILCCAQLLGCAQKALDLAVDYVGGRVQFGRPLGTFQAVQHHCADMATAVEATRVLVYEATWKVERGEATATDLAFAKAAASRTGVFVTTQSHQLHGGIGVTDEYPLQLYSRRAKERSVAWGSLHESLLAIAGTVERDEAWV